MATIFPADPQVNDEYQGYRYNGTSWDIIGQEYNPTVYSGTEPSNAKAGDIWIDSSTDVPSISPETILTTTAAASTYQPIVSGVSSTEIGYLDGVTSAIQTQLNSKLSSSTASSTYAALSGAGFTGQVYATKFLASSVGGDEGGEIFLGPALTNTTLAGGITIDVWQNRLRIFEQGGNARGAFLDISSLADGVASTIAVPGLDGVPYRMSAGTASFATGSVVSNGSANVAVTFPASRFSVAPIVTTTIQSAPGGTGNLVPRAISVSSTGFSLYVYNPGSVTQTWTATLSVAWQAVQMTSGAAGG